MAEDRDQLGVSPAKTKCADEAILMMDDEFSQRLSSISAEHFPHSLKLLHDLLAQAIFLGRAVSLLRFKEIEIRLEVFTAALDGQRRRKVRRLLSAAVEPESRRTALHYCAVFNYSEHAEILLRLGCDADSLDVRQWTPLLCAYAHGSEAVVNLLVKYSRDPVALACVNELKAFQQGTLAPDNAMNKLIRAIVFNKTKEALAIIREHGSEAASPSPACHDFGDVYELGPTIRFAPLAVDMQMPSGRTPLFYAAMQGCMEIVKALVSVPGVQLCQQIENKRLTPLAVALCRGHSDVARLLLQQPVQEGGVRMSDRLHGYLYAIHAPGHAAVECLVRDNFLCPASDALAEAALFTACSIGCLPIIKQLIDGGVNANIKWALRGELTFYQPNLCWCVWKHDSEDMVFM